MQFAIKSVFPVRVVYQWLICFAVIVIVPFLWYALHMAADAVIAFMTLNFPDNFSGQRVGVVNFQNALWTYMPVLVIIPVFVWAVMETLKERRRAELWQ
jgi:hypothetical protein